ncbi:MarR family winged helix-turn-helix transcriptional regulator [Sporosarcina limicola]|uniref:DNA-binding MarR family transcriptional regulator n=1 Tax=Sporosarcina limicola TaxID=34101 RepID=A0A927REB4_9BACL|nr:MarR family transcriptional regulator [Sporosarcina limicola]MBE1554447.1 DNA-binding MarR family transcriptional regulator [Sporosarcina limicola]
MGNQNLDKTLLSPRNKRLALLVWFRLSRFYNQSIRQTNQHLKQWNLSAAQFDILVQIGLYQPIAQQELADKLVVTKGNVAQLLKKMETMGWIKREQHWKTKFITLTEEGSRFYKEVVPPQEQFQATQFCGLDREEQAQLLYLLKKLQKSIDPEEETV